MARVKITLPEKLLASITVPVRITDINYGNHVGNDSFVAIIHEARMQWLNNHQYSEMNIGGAGLIMSDLMIAFKHESFYGDTIEVKLFVSEITSVSFELYYELSTLRNKLPVILGLAKTAMVCYDYQNKRITEMPAALVNLLGDKNN